VQAPAPVLSHPSAILPGNTSDEVVGLEDISPHDSLKELQEAQAKYYRESARKIIEANTPAGWIRENAAFFAGLLAGIVAFLSFFQAARTAAANLRLSLENSRDQRLSQRDTQFYEALKRFGDKDSPALRASAAALIAQLARRAPSRSAGYLEVAVDQFAAALRMEPDPVVIEAVVGAVGYLAGVVNENFVAAQEMLERIYRTNRAQQNQFVSNILRYFVVSGIELENGLWPRTAIIEIAARTGYRARVIETLFSTGQLPTPLIQAEQSAAEALDEAKRSEQRAALANRIFILGLQLRASSEAIRLCLSALTPDAVFAYGPRRIPGPVADTLATEGRTGEVSQDLQGVFLPQMDLKGVNLKGADLAGARLQYTNLFFANLEGSNLDGAFLDGAHLSHLIKGASLSGAHLTDTIVGHVDLTQVSLEGTNWWDAEFERLGPDFAPTFDQPLIDRLFESLGAELPPGVRRRGNTKSLAGAYIASILAKLSVAA
jgi:uncharacterized protein YjbI with pentapeptide repeats